MALLSLQAFKTKWAALTGRFKDNNTFDIAEKDYREFSADIVDSLFEPVESLRARVEKLEQPAPVPPEGVKWKVFPKVSIEGSTVKVTPSEAEFHGSGVPLPSPNARENVPVPPVGWGTRIDILAATATGWAYIYGEDPWVTPAMEIEGQPETELLFAAYLFWNSAGGAVEEPVVFVKTINGQAPDANGNINLTVTGGTTINSTDDIKSEGAVNKWFTDARVYLAKATNYVIQGTARAITQNDSLAMILGIFENRLNILRDTKIGAENLDVSDISAGEQKILTVRKALSGAAEIGNAMVLVDRFASNGILGQLALSNPWVNFERTITGDNSGGALGELGQTIVTNREKYDCVFADATQATWRIKFASQTLIRGYSARHDSIIAALETEAGWNNNTKIINTVNCFQGEMFVHDLNATGYSYVCIAQQGTVFTWRRFGVVQPAVDLYFTQTEQPELVAALRAHDFTASWYDQAALPEAQRAGVGRRFADHDNRRLYEVVTANRVARII